ncbi:hypothetical protein RND81_05G271100 [Saponaria officinalis]|uniref:Uncharacterized protein n=1 Tax=Saponaria officinalis TaxID=3572 RepID=A0AAW1L0E5_SAPOF
MDNSEDVDITQFLNFDQTKDTLSQTEVINQLLAERTQFLTEKNQLLAERGQFLIEKGQLITERNKAVEIANINRKNVIKVILLLGIAYKERDEANDKLRKLLLVKPYSLFSESIASHALDTNRAVPSTQPVDVSLSPITTHLTTQPQPPAPAPLGPNMGPSSSRGPDNSYVSSLNPRQNVDIQTMGNVSPNTSYVSSFTSSQKVGFGPMYDDGPSSSSYDDYFIDVDFDPGFGYMGSTSVDNMNEASSSHDQATTSYDKILAKDMSLPENGKFLQSVQEASSLLDAAMVTLPLPQWRNPPQALPISQLPPLPMPKDKRPQYN